MAGVLGARLLLGLTTLLTACGHTPPLSHPIQQAPLGLEYTGLRRSVGSDSSSMSFKYESGKGLSVPSHPHVTDSARLSVRPDLLVVGFAVRDLGATPQAALEAARGKVDSVAAELIRASRSTTIKKTKGFQLARNMRDGKLIDVSATVDGVLEVPLSPNEDFWARSQLYVAIVETAQRVVAAYETQDGLRAVSFETPAFRIADPEAQRAELIQRWVERARQFAAAAQSEQALLFIRSCAPPGPVVQKSTAFDEVSLELAIDCRIDTKSEPGDITK
jgi:hypothetical protein